MARGVLTADSDGAAEEAASPGLLGTEAVGADPAVSGPALGRAHRSLILELQAFLGFKSWRVRGGPCSLRPPTVLLHTGRREMANVRASWTPRRPPPGPSSPPSLHALRRADGLAFSRFISGRDRASLWWSFLGGCGREERSCPAET